MSNSYCLTRKKCSLVAVSHRTSCRSCIHVLKGDRATLRSYSSGSSNSCSPGQKRSHSQWQFSTLHRENKLTILHQRSFGSVEAATSENKLGWKKRSWTGVSAQPVLRDDNDPFTHYKPRSSGDDIFTKTPEVEEAETVELGPL